MGKKSCQFLFKLNFTPNTLGCYGLKPVGYFGYVGYKYLFFRIIYSCLVNLRKNNSGFARSPLSLPQSLFSRSPRSTVCNPGHPHPMITLRITNGRLERAKKQSLGEREGRSCKHRRTSNCLKLFLA